MPFDPLPVVLLALFAAGCTQEVGDAPASVASPSAIAVGERPRAIESGYMDGDGHIDLAVANADGDSVTILVAGEGGNYVRRDYPAGNEPSDLELVDLDGDGDLDIAVANHETSGVTILLNDGDARFAAMAGSPFDLGARPHLHGLASGDFDGDGRIDIAADSSDSDAVALLPGAEGGFGPARSVRAGAFPYYRIDEISVGGGARTGILVPSPRAGTVGVLDISQGERFGPVIDASGAMMVVSANLDGAGERDIVAVGDNAVRMWQAAKDGYELVGERRFDNPVEIAVGDIDGDGVDEIAASLWDDERIFLLSADASLRGEVTVCMRPAALLLADLDGDGRAELVAGCWNEPELRIIRDLP